MRYTIAASDLVKVDHYLVNWCSSRLLFNYYRLLNKKQLVRFSKSETDTEEIVYCSSDFKTTRSIRRVIIHVYCSSVKLFNLI
jgi:hypothetical protein